MYTFLLRLFTSMFCANFRSGDKFRWHILGNLIYFWNYITKLLISNCNLFSNERNVFIQNSVDNSSADIVYKEPTYLDQHWASDKWSCNGNTDKRQLIVSSDWVLNLASNSFLQNLKLTQLIRLSTENSKLKRLKSFTMSNMSYIEPYSHVSNDPI